MRHLEGTEPGGDAGTLIPEPLGAGPEDDDHDSGESD